MPPYVKSTVWPSDINAAIATLHAAALPPSDKNTPPEPQPPDKEPSSTHVPSTSSVPPSAAAVATSSSEQSTSSGTPAVSEPTQSAPPVQQPHPHLQPMFPHQRYGFSPSTAYPHNPYYPAHSTTYPYPHSAYMPYPPIQNGYPHVPPAYPAPSVYNSLMPLPPPPESANADDLPSYEEMIVEALSSTTDPEGYAPKDLFTWMASRYPLQSNFRPSASQALQKAYRRGRFEKSSGGKYRLNPTWDGGNVRYRYPIFPIDTDI